MVPPPPPPPPPPQQQQQHRTSKISAATNRAINKKKNQQQSAKQRLDEYERQRNLRIAKSLEAAQQRGRTAAAAVAAQGQRRQKDRSGRPLPPIRTAAEVTAASDASAARSLLESERNAGPHKTAKQGPDEAAKRKLLIFSKSPAAAAASQGQRPKDRSGRPLPSNASRGVDFGDDGDGDGDDDEAYSPDEDNEADTMDQGDDDVLDDGIEEIDPTEGEWLAMDADSNGNSGSGSGRSLYFHSARLDGSNDSQKTTTATRTTTTSNSHNGRSAAQQQQQQKQQKKKRSISHFEAEGDDKDDDDTVSVASVARPFASKNSKKQQQQQQQQQQQNKKQRTIPSANNNDDDDDDDDDTESESEDDDDQGKYPAGAPAAAARTASFRAKQYESHNSVDQKWLTRADQAITKLQGLINNNHSLSKDSKTQSWIWKNHWKFAMGRRRKVNYDKQERRKKLQIISSLMNWPMTPPAETDNPDDVQQKQQGENGTRTSSSPSAAAAAAAATTHNYDLGHDTANPDDAQRKQQGEDGTRTSSSPPAAAAAAAAAAATTHGYDLGHDGSIQDDTISWEDTGNQIIDNIHDLIINKKIEHLTEKHLSSADYGWLQQHHWKFAAGRQKSHYDIEDRRDTLQCISFHMQWPMTPAEASNADLEPQQENEDDGGKKRTSSSAAASSSSAPSAAASTTGVPVPLQAIDASRTSSLRRGNRDTAASSHDNEAARAVGQVARVRTGGRVDDDTNEDDVTAITFDLSRDSMREELCKITGKKYTPREGREAIRTVHKCVITENEEIKDDALKGFQTLFLGLGGIDSVLTFMRSRHQKDNIISLKLAAAILVCCCSDAKTDDESNSPTSSSSNDNDPAVLLCKQIVQFDGIETLLRILNRFQERSTELEVISLFDQIWHALSNICAVDGCLAMMEKEWHTLTIEYAMQCMQAVAKTSDNRGDSPVENSTNDGYKRKVRQMGKSCLLTIDNLCDDENKDSKAESKIDKDAYLRLNILEHVVDTICAAIKLSIKNGQEWDDDSLEIISNVLTLIATFDQNGWLEKDDFHLISPFLDDLLRTLSSKAYEDFGEELFEMITAMKERVGKRTMQESIVTAALQNVVVAKDFTPPEVAKKKAKALLKDIWK